MCNKMCWSNQFIMQFLTHITLEIIRKKLWKHPFHYLNHIFHSHPPFLNIMVKNMILLRSFITHRPRYPFGNWFKHHQNTIGCSKRLCRRLISHLMSNWMMWHPFFITCMQKIGHFIPSTWITFDWGPKQKEALMIVVSLNKSRIMHTIIDNGLGLNICSINLIHKLGVDKNLIEPIDIFYWKKRWRKIQYELMQVNSDLKIRLPN